MKKEIILTTSAARLSDGEPFFVGVNDGLFLAFSSRYYLLTDLIVELKNGQKRGKYRIREQKLAVPSEYLFAGKLEISVALMARGEVAKEWVCTPVLLKEKESGLEGADELEETKNALAALEKDFAALAAKYDVLANKFNALIEAHNALADTVSAVKENY